MITGRKHPQEALELAMSAAAALERTTRAPLPERLSVYGGWFFLIGLALSSAGAGGWRCLLNG